MRELILFVSLVFLAGCPAPSALYHDADMDFGAIRTVAVMPFANLTSDGFAAERVRDVLAAMLLSTESMYVLPPGEVARGVSRAGIRNPAAPTAEEVVKLGGIIKVDAVITGVLREYGTVRSTTTSANVISVGLEMMETQTGRVVWTASSAKGGIKIWHRLLGGGGQPMNDVTAKAVNDLLDKLFQ